MSKFGFQPEAPSPSAKLPKVYMPAVVHLGEHSEKVFYSLKVWETGEYVQHWRRAAQALLAGEAPVMFCTDLGEDGCSCFVGWPQGPRFVFEEWLLKRDAVVRMGLNLRPVNEVAEPSEGVSHFHVEAAEVKAFVSNGA